MREIYFTPYVPPVSEVGEILLATLDEKLCLADWVARKNADQKKRKLTQQLNAHWIEKKTPYLEKVIQELDAYFAGQLTCFQSSLQLYGTDFQNSVWQALCEIPYGTTVTYLEVAEILGRPKSVRAVANAIGANPISLIVPCHRVIGSNGSLTGYAGGLEAKRVLLQLEGLEQAGS